MPNLEFDGKSYEVDEEGYLMDPANWSKELAEHMAKTDGLELSEAHWEVINFLRDYFQKYQIAPMIKILTKEIGKTMGKDKGNTKYLYELYPAGPAKQACRYAGLPKPTGCV
jgi:tRNA 2-thiouridine synthesizing protein E